MTRRQLAAALASAHAAYLRALQTHDGSDNARRALREAKTRLEGLEAATEAVLGLLAEDHPNLGRDGQHAIAIG